VPFFTLVEGVAADLARPLSASETAAVHRAARQLAAAGRCESVLDRAQTAAASRLSDDGCPNHREHD
jgi:hypothetical protein